MKNVFGVLGGGSWGTALVKILLENNKYVNWYLRNEETIEFIKKFKKNPNYLRALNIDTSKTKLSSSIEKTVKNSTIIILAIPSPFLDSELKKIKSSLNKKTIFSALKGR